MSNSNTRAQTSLGNYDERVDRKRDRLEAASEKAQQQSNQFYQQSKNLADMIPFGQPILVGHHSEGKARRHHERIWNDMGKSVKAGQKAEHYQQRADSVGSAGIASDDAQALEKLREKLDSLQRSQTVMKAANKIVRKAKLSQEGKIQLLMTECKLSESQAKTILEPDCSGRVGFASYQLSNNNANIKRVERRIKELEKLHQAEALSDSGEIDGLDWKVTESDGRIQFIFSGKPEEETRKILKSNGFKWSRYSGSWVRKITANAVSSANYIIKQLKA